MAIKKRDIGNAGCPYVMHSGCPIMDDESTGINKGAIKEARFRSGSSGFGST
jgi:hypothetical protein